MLGFGFDLDPQLKQQFADEWNERLHSIRMAGFIISILMIVLGVVFLIFPQQSMSVGLAILTLLIIAFGVFGITEYATLPFGFRMGGLLVSGILNILVGILLFSMPNDGMVVAFAFILAFELFMMGIEQLSFSSTLRFISASNYGWLIASGVLNIIFALFLLFMPLSSAVALWIVLAIYLLAGGISLLIECIKSKDLKAK